ncbi:MAG: formate/nitrite transporter family protein [Clostridia bacterium]|nr:formate/nitrite transporter family protein [Clostridia bacterium]
MLTPNQVSEKFLAVGKAKTQLPLWKMFLLGIAAGAFIGLAGVGCTQMNALLGGGVGKMMGALIFPVGLVLVILAGSELFTGNCLIALSVAQKRVKLRSMLKNWVVVYIANFIGAALVAVCVALLGGITAESFQTAALSSAAAKCTLTFGQALIRGVLCNVLVCLAVWVATAAETAGGKVAALYMPIALFVLCGFEHIVANMYFIPTGLFYQAVSGVTTEGLTVANALMNHFIPVTLGNIIGGVAVALLYAAVYRNKKEN